MAKMFYLNVIQYIQNKIVQLKFSITFLKGMVGKKNFFVKLTLFCLYLTKLPGVLYHFCKF